MVSASFRVAPIIHHGYAVDFCCLQDTHWLPNKRSQVKEAATKDNYLHTVHNNKLPGHFLKASFHDEHLSSQGLLVGRL
jgi:hypothetical protein